MIHYPLNVNFEENDMRLFTASSIHDHNHALKLRPDWEDTQDTPQAEGGLHRFGACP